MPKFGIKSALKLESNFLAVQSKFLQKIFATKIGENVTNILNCCFSKQIYTLAH